MIRSAVRFRSVAQGQRSAIFVILNLILAWFQQEYVMTREVYHNLLSDQLEILRINQQIELMERLNVWGYFLLPLLMLLKYSLLSLLLQLPLMFNFIEIPFKKIFRVVILASASSIALTATHLVWLFSLSVNQINETALKVTPLSLSNLIDISRYPDSSISLLNMFNIFEIGWLILIFMGFNSISNEKLKKIDVALLAVGIWTFLLVLQYALVNYLEKAFR